eukprot:7389509-Prymnesium_polylepis.1
MSSAQIRHEEELDRLVGHPRPSCRSGSGSEAGRSVTVGRPPRRPKRFSALRAADGRHRVG